MKDYLRAEISAAAVRWNVGLLRRDLGPRTRLCAVVKADCYGHGLATLLPVLAAAADGMAVATPAEAVTLRGLGYRGQVLVFSACAYADSSGAGAAVEELIAHEVTLTIVSASEAAAVAAAARRVGKRASVHVKVDTGMGRSGVLPESAAALVDQVRRETLIQIGGLYTHLATADEADKAFAHEQLRRFNQAVDSCGPGSGLTRHVANSAAVIDLPATHLDMVRPGIALYGYQPSDQMQRRLPLRPALRLAGPLMQVKTLPAGSKCGYGLTHVFERDSRVGVVPVGYADGYPRCLANRARMRVGGHDAPVCGRISMDQTIIDLTDVPQARVGDEVEIISRDPSAPNSVESLARLAGTIPYELTSRLGPRISRVLVEDQEPAAPTGG